MSKELQIQTIALLGFATVIFALCAVLNIDIISTEPLKFLGCIGLASITGSFFFKKLKRF